MNWPKPSWTSSKRQALLISGGALWPNATLIHKAPPKGTCEAMQAGVKPSTTESQIFTNKHAKLNKTQRDTIRFSKVWKTSLCPELSFLPQTFTLRQMQKYS